MQKYRCLAPARNSLSMGDGPSSMRILDLDNWNRGAERGSRIKLVHKTSLALALAFCILTSASSPLLAQSLIPKPASARDYYSQAAAALVAKDTAKATLSLTKLVEQFPEDEMAPLAAMRLAQCHMAAARYDAAIAVLEKWLPELAKSTKARALDPASELDAQATLARAYFLTAQYERVLELSKQANGLAAHPSALNDGQQRAIQQIKSLATAASQRREATQAVALREAARLVREKRYASAQAELDKVDDGLLSTDWSWRYHVLAAQCLLGVNKPQPAIERLNKIDLSALKPKEQAVVRVLRLEVALAAGSLKEADKELEALDASAQNDAHQSALLDLRRAELALLRKDRETVDRITRAAKSKYPNFESLHEFDLLLARNLLARIEFDEARQLLTTLVQSEPTTDPTLVPRAQWLIGESYLLSQDYSAAIAAYSQVIDDQHALVWAESALMQRGKCYEMTGQFAEAQNDYNRLMKDFPSSTLQPDARVRLSQLPTGSDAGKLK